MVFWAITVAMSALVVAILARSLMQQAPQEARDVADYDLQVYRDQLAEVERDVARGVIGAEDGERARTEISRRILAADAARQVGEDTAGPRSKVLIAGLAAVVVGGALGLYAAFGQPGYGDLALQDRIEFAERMRESRPDQAAAMASLPPFVPAPDTSAEFLNLMEQLRTTVAGRPGDLQGHMLLAQNEARLGDFGAAARAQQEVLRIKGDEATPTDIADYGELLVMAAGGYVSPEAEDAFRAALGQDEENALSRYYIGLMMVQTGRPDIAFRLWDGLLRRGPPDAPWIEPILAQIEPLAQLAGVNYSIPAIGGAAAAGPSVEDIEAAAEMTAEERMEMIGGMVDGLSNRLATEGGPPRDWARLITSLAILGNPSQALAVYNDAMAVFGDNPGAVDIIRKAGQDAGVAE